MLDSLKVLILNFSYEPLQFCSAKRGIVMVLAGRAEKIECDGYAPARMTSPDNPETRMKSLTTLIILLVVPLFSAGCGDCPEIRSFSLKLDMAPGDLSHYHANLTKGDGDGDAKPAAGSVQIEECNLAFPAALFPLMIRNREGSADYVEDDGYHLHFDDFRAFCLFLGFSRSIANFDGKGVNISWQESHGFVFGALRTAVGEQRIDTKYTAPTSSFSLLWGLLGRELTAEGGHWTLLWIPLN